MKKEEVLLVVDTLIPKLYGFAYALLGDELEAEQLIIDSYTVFLMREKTFLFEEAYDLEDSKSRASIKKYFLRELTREIYELSLKRYTNIHKSQKNQLEYNTFFNLNLNKRALIYLKEIGLNSVADLQEVFTLERHQVIELYHNSRFELLSTNEGVET